MIKDKVIIITGASSGIGEATAKLLASKGAKLVLGARRSAPPQTLARGHADHGDVHIAIQEHHNGKVVDWLEQVTDAQYHR